MKLLAVIPILLGIISVSQNIQHASMASTLFVLMMLCLISIVLWGIAASKKAIEKKAKKI